eukprot:scaffold1954_cov268-Pinguiococcus_pyrenoidosus.AAC.195
MHGLGPPGSLGRLPFPFVRALLRSDLGGHLQGSPAVAAIHAVDLHGVLSEQRRRDEARGVPDYLAFAVAFFFQRPRHYLI